MLEVGETWTYTAAHTVTQAEIDSNGGGDGDIDNIATADSNETGPDTDDAAAPIYTLTAAGLWTYTLDNSNADVQARNVGEILSDTFIVHDGRRHFEGRHHHHQRHQRRCE